MCRERKNRRLLRPVLPSLRAQSLFPEWPTPRVAHGIGLYRGFHKSSTKPPTSQIAIIPCRGVPSQTYESHANPNIRAPLSLLCMLRNITSLSAPVSTWPCKTTSWHRRHPRLTFDTARSTFSLEILFTISVYPRCWGGLPLQTIFIATVSIRLSTLHHSSAST